MPTKAQLHILFRRWCNSVFDSLKLLCYKYVFTNFITYISVGTNYPFTSYLYFYWHLLSCGSCRYLLACLDPPVACLLPESQECRPEGSCSKRPRCQLGATCYSIGRLLDEFPSDCETGCLRISALQQCSGRTRA